jgi:ABC-type sugar transport system ATPase subunit
LARVKLDGVRTIYNEGTEQVAVDRVDVDINDGEFVVLVGPSGCGKSTTLRMIAGLESISAGTVAIGDRVVNDVPPKERDIAMVFQNYALYPHMSVRENLGFALRLRGMSASEIDSRVGAAAATLGLDEYLDRKPRQLSGGQRQRVAIAQQFMCSEHFLLMDEPFSGLDLIAQENACEFIREMARADELTTYILVTHDVRAACSVADTIWLLGRDRDASGNVIPGARVQAQFNLIDRGIAWQPNVMDRPEFLALLREIRELFPRL